MAPGPTAPAGAASSNASRQTASMSERRSSRSARLPTTSHGCARCLSSRTARRSSSDTPTAVRSSPRSAQTLQTSSALSTSPRSAWTRVSRSGRFSRRGRSRRPSSISSPTPAASAGSRKTTSSTTSPPTSWASPPGRHCRRGTSSRRTTRPSRRTPSACSRRGWARPPSRSRRATSRWSPIRPRSRTWSRRRPMRSGPWPPADAPTRRNCRMTVTEEQTPLETRMRYTDTSTRRIAADNAIEYAYRELGEGEVPLILLQHFRGNLDNWDPALMDALAADRRVVAFDNVGVGATTGRTPNTIETMAHGAIAFLEAMDFQRVDLLGFSIGSFVAQEIALIRPDLLRRVVLASSAPQGAAGMHGWASEVIGAVGRPETTPQEYISVFFAPTDTSRAAGQQAASRIFGARTADRDEPTTWQTRQAQYDADYAWRIHNHSLPQRPAPID